MILAAIDIGSNAARLLIMQAEPYADGTIDYTKLSFLRIPLRLGGDVFEKGYIDKEKARDLLDTMQAYALLMKIYKVEHYKAYATSAMRDARNGPEIAEQIKQETGIDIRIISGSEEAAIIYETHIAEHLSPEQSYLYIDVGGGSTEVTLFARNRTLFKESFNIGTIRLLNDTVPDRQMEQLKEYLKKQTKGIKNLKAIGTGGNINKVYTLSGQKEGRPLSLPLLKDYLKVLSNTSLEERMHRYNMRRDRADVIVPALRLYISVMRWAGIEEIYVPRIGLADGIIRMLFRENNH